LITKVHEKYFFDCEEAKGPILRDLGRLRAPQIYKFTESEGGDPKNKILGSRGGDKMRRPESIVDSGLGFFLS
jgi:hypothetical protein